MTTQIQRRRGTTAQHSTFTGAVGEVTVDTDKEVLVVHDGAQAGGYPQMRENGSNSALSLGSAATPSLKFAGDPNTGIYSPGADQVAISTNGTGRVFIESNGRVGVGTSAPGELLHLASGSSPAIRIKNTNAGAGTFSQLQLATANSFDEGRVVLKGISENAGNNSVTFAVETSAAGGSPTEKLRITSAGLVGIGVSSPATTLDSVGASGRHARIGGFQFAGTSATADAGNNLLSSGAYWNGTNFTATQTSSATVQLGNGALNFYTESGLTAGNTYTGNVRMSLDSSGRLGIGTTSPAHALTVNSGSISISNRGSGNSYLLPDWRIYNSSSGNALVFDNYTTEAFRVDSSNRLLVGTSSARTLKTPEPAGGNDILPFFQLEGAGGSNARERGAAFVYNNGDIYGPTLFFGKTRGTTNGSFTIPSQNDAYGSITFQGADGTKFVEAGSIRAEVDGTPGTNDMPGRLVFSTTADGASSPTERMRITNVGFTKCLGDQGSPDSATGAWHEFLSNQASVRSAHVKNFNTSYTGQNVIISCNRTTTNNTYQNLTVENGNATGRFIVLDSGNCQNTNNSYTGTSDVKLKQDIVDASSQWDDIKNLQVRKYRFKNKPDEHLQIGLIAQEVESISPGLVEESPDYDQDGNQLETTTKSVKYSVLYMKAVKALQEAMERIEVLEQRLADAGIA